MKFFENQSSRPYFGTTISRRCYAERRLTKEPLINIGALRFSGGLHSGDYVARSEPGPKLPCIDREAFFVHLGRRYSEEESQRQLIDKKN